MAQYQNYSLDPQLFSDAMEISNAVKEAVLPIASACVGILFSIELIRTLFGVSRFDFLKLLKYVVFLYVFADYNNVMGLIDGTFEGILQSVAGHNFSVSGPVGSTVQTINFDANSVVANESFIISMAKSVMYFFRDIAKVILLASGPIAIALGFIPGVGESIFMGWLKNYIHVTFWAFTFLILDLMTGFILMHMDLSFADSLTKDNNSSWLNVFTGDFSFFWDLFVNLFVDNFKETMACIALSLGYFFTPWLTNKYIGTAASSGFIGRSLGTAKAAGNSTKAVGSFVANVATGNFAGALGIASQGGKNTQQKSQNKDGDSPSAPGPSTKANSNGMKKNKSEN